MPEWQERIVRDTRPALRGEHDLRYAAAPRPAVRGEPDLRYAAASPIVIGSSVWCGLGCGGGVAAASAFGDRFEGHAVLVDVAQDALDEASAIVQAGTSTRVRADLAD